MIRIDSQVLETATKYVGTGQNLTLKPWLASAWKQTDAHTWQFTVRPGITFSNGEALTAAAFKASLDSVLAKKDGKVRSHYKNLSITVVDDMTFNVASTFANDGSVPAQLSALYIMPPKYLAQVGAEQFGIKPIGTGPYTVSAFTPGSKVTLTANPQYWGDPKPSIQTVTVSAVGDPSTRISQLLAGGADLVDGVTPDLVSRLTGTAEARSTPTVERTFLLINTKSGPTADVNVRKAINMAIDRDSIVKDLLDGNGFATQNIFVPLESGYNASFKPFPYDPTAAKALVTAAGAAAKKPFKLYYPTEFASFPAIAQAIQAELQDIGLNVTLEAGTASPLLSALKASTTGGMAVWNFGPGYIDSSYMLDIYFAEGTSYGALASSPEATDLSERARGTTDPKERQSLYEQLTKNVVQDNAFVAPLFSNVDIWGASTSLSWSPSAAADYNFALASFK
jgi:peptide/nickel transport system substrate-binding protein